MLVERTSPDGVVTLASPLLAHAGFAHAFSTRHGGVSGAPGRAEVLALLSSSA